jgi:hypothetical protein
VQSIVQGALRKSSEPWPKNDSELFFFTHRSRGDSSVFVLDAETSECLHYEPVLGYPPTKYVHIPREILKEHPEVEVRNDLVDCFIDVCSVEVIRTKSLCTMRGFSPPWLGPLALSR